MTSTKKSLKRDTDYSILPSHIITEILKHLTISDFKSAAQVCKSWYYGSTDPYFIRKLCVRITSKNFQTILNFNQRNYSKFIMYDMNVADENVIIKFLQHYRQYLSEIEFFYCTKMNLAQILKVYVQNLNNLDTLTIKSKTNVFATVLEGGGLNSVILNLKHFKLYTVDEFSESESVKNLSTFLRSIKNLTSLEIHSKVDSIFNNFIESFQKLSLNSNLSALSLHVTKHTNFLILLKYFLSIDFKNLIALQLFDGYHDIDEITLDIETVDYCKLIEMFSEKFNNLREFHVGYANDVILKNIFKFMKNLKILGISCAHRIEFKEIDVFYVIEKLQLNVYTYHNSLVGSDRPIESNVFKVFDNKFTNLKELKINGEINRETLGSLVENCSNLEVLHISGLVRYDTGLHKIYNQLARLKILKINGRTLNRGCE